MIIVSSPFSPAAIAHRASFSLPLRSRIDMKLWIVCCSNRVDLEPAVWGVEERSSLPPPLYISMTKHWGGLLAPPVITVGAGAQRDHHLDCRTSHSSSNTSCHCSTNPLLELGGRLHKSTGMAQDSGYRAKPSDQSAWEMQDGTSSGGKKKNYQRYPKPPYSYLAMVAMVIQNSPEKKLTLSEVGYLPTRDAQLLSLKWLKFIRNVNEL